MSDENPSILSHVSIGTNDFARAVAFYDAILTPLGCRRVLDFPNAVAYGRQFPEFWVQTPIDGKPATVGNGTHFCFLAPSKQAVDAFHQAALKAGATDDGAPGPRPLYGPPYYGCFVRDPDGHKVEANFWDTSLGGHEGT
ncbi:VOC family protein [Corallococcus exiguus]|uniref:VOC family protein n=1 Tax=Corallococcus TaxID=83461 RepID=UPI000EA2FEA2|nr:MULTISPECIES: VOC family protein [Corallococcus]NNC20236.1 VOC family protein [Corallococcus exiguus]NRD65490.1 VOC family protein [Corallococcus exiguus]RKH18371.1 VOC family protein [Corallococcus sp. CA041A]RKI09985.1 VOC family protein [Corallococcus sp. AB030]